MRLFRRHPRGAHPGELTCRELVRLVTDYLEDALPRSERRRFEEHLRGCEGCSTYVEQMRETISLTGRLSSEAIDPRAREVLLAAFRDWRLNGG